MDEAGHPLVSLMDLRQLGRRPHRQEVIEGRLADAADGLRHLLAMGGEPQLERMLGEAARDSLGEQAELFRRDGGDVVGHSATGK